jgi:hypothetical protein
MDESGCSVAFGLAESDRPLKTTISLCATCLAHVPAVILRASRARVDAQELPAHTAPAEALVESDVKFYRLSNKDRWGRRVRDRRVRRRRHPPVHRRMLRRGRLRRRRPMTLNGAGNGASAIRFAADVEQVVHRPGRSHQRLQPRVPVCYSDAKGDRKMPLELFKRYMLRLVERRAGSIRLQLTGGEATLHPSSGR